MKIIILLFCVFVLAGCQNQSRPWPSTSDASGNSSTGPATKPTGNDPSRPAAGSAGSDSGSGGAPVVSAPALLDSHLVKIGKTIFNGRGACMGCHKITADRLVGPGLAGIYNSERTLQTGESVTADEAYIRESILNPNAKIVKGYPPAMPPTNLSEEEISGLVEYLKSLK